VSETINHITQNNNNNNALVLEFIHLVASLNSGKTTPSVMSVFLPAAG
jgi:hypothetical protein